MSGNPPTKADNLQAACLANPGKYATVAWPKKNRQHVNKAKSQLEAAGLRVSIERTADLYIMTAIKREEP